MTGKMTDDTGDAGCLTLACIGVLFGFVLFALSVTMIIIVVRGGLPGC